MESSYKFLQKLWSLHNKILGKKSDKDKKNDEIEIFTNQIIQKITNNLENFHKLLCEIMLSAPSDMQDNLITAHPMLAGKKAQNKQHLECHFE